MIAIVNVTTDGTQELDDYEIRINREVLGTFKHKRGYNGVVQCLRDAADAMEAQREYVKTAGSTETLASLAPGVMQRTADEQAEIDGALCAWTPQDWENPDWSGGRRVHEWKRYPDNDVRELWPSLSIRAKILLATNFNFIASDEEWD